MKAVYLFILLAVLSACTHKYPAPNSQLPQSMEDAVSSNFRNPENEERDQYQHPQETLEFFGLKPQMTVVEISPGAGYFTEILAPYLSKEGNLYLAVPRMPPRPPKVLVENEKKLQDILLRHHDIQNKTKLVPFEPHDKRNKIQKDFADMVLTFNHVHNWVAKKEEKDAFKFFYDILKPGGTLGLVQHRIQKGKKRVPESGYMYESEVINLALAAGFKFVGKSEINANPKDTADYPKGVWVLPPTYRLGEKNKDKYEDIGESDRMTLKFVKPI
jgi:predicted methyltransferase